MVFVAIVIAKFALNLSKYIQCRRYLKLYLAWVENPTWNMVQHRSQVLKLLNNAETRDFQAISHRVVGPELLRMTASVKESFPNKVHASENVHILHEAIGTYRSRFTEAFNPLYWIECAVFLPRTVLTYLGIAADSVPARFSQIVWWGINLIFTIWITFMYESQISSGVNNFIDWLLQFF